MGFFSKHNHNISRWDVHLLTRFKFFYFFETVLWKRSVMSSVLSSILRINGVSHGCVPAASIICISLFYFVYLFFPLCRLSRNKEIWPRGTWPRGTWQGSNSWNKLFARQVLYFSLIGCVISVNQTVLYILLFFFLSARVLTLDPRTVEDNLSVSEKQRNKLSGNVCGSSGFVSKNKFEVFYYSNILL